MFFLHLFELLSFQSAVLPAFTVLTSFCLDNKNNTRGGHFHINLYGTCRSSGYHFSAEIPEPGIKQNVVELILFELLSKVEGTQEGHHKLAIPAYSRE